MFKKILEHPVWRIWFFSELVCIAIVMVAHALYGRFASLAAFVCVFVLNLIVIFFTEDRIASLFSKTLIEGRDTWGLVASATEFAKKAGIPTPQIYLLEIASSHSYSMCLTPSLSAIFLSETLLEDLSPTELRALIAYEVARIQMGFSLGATLASQLGAIVAFLPRAVDQFVFFQIFRKIQGRKHFCEDLFAPLTTFVCLIYIHPGAAIRADAKAVTWLGDQNVLAQTLWKLESLTSTRRLDTPLHNSYLFTLNPLTKQRWHRYFLLQVSVRKRIRRLLGHYPV